MIDWLIDWLIDGCWQEVTPSCHQSERRCRHVSGNGGSELWRVVSTRPTELRVSPDRCAPGRHHQPAGHRPVARQLRSIERCAWPARQHGAAPRLQSRTRPVRCRDDEGVLRWRVRPSGTVLSQCWPPSTRQPASFLLPERSCYWLRRYATFL